MNYLSNLDETCQGQVAANHHLIIFWRSKVKGQGHTLVQVCGSEDIHVEPGASKSIFLICIELCHWLSRVLYTVVSVRL